MKRHLTIFAAIFFLGLLVLFGAASSVRAQDAPPPQEDRPMQQQPQDEDAPQPPDQNQNDQIQIQDEAADAQAAQANQQEQQQQATMQPGVARVSWIRGDVSTQRGDNGEWVAAIVNTPISQGDRVSTGDRSRAELQLDFADTLRMSDRVTVKIATLTRQQILLQLGEGLTTYSVSRGAEASSEIDTPNAAIRPLGEGSYRILVNSDAETQVTVLRGSADISTPQGSTRVDAGQLITIAGTDNPQYRVSQAPAHDEWDNWNNDRDRVHLNSEGARNTNRYYTGSQDLDPYGTWKTVPDYGRVWVPNVAPGWAPYRAGRWVWQPYFGWTWVSYEPWGWAPYHYGRWLPYGAGWAWWPGPVAVYPAYYPVWAPAYVSFFGFGGGFGFGVGFGFGFGFGHIGWLPCGPGDWYHPWYGRWGGGYHVGNFHNTTVVNNFHNGWAPLRGGGRGFSNVNAAFRNDQVRSGMSSMESGNFGRGTVPSNQRAPSAGEFRNASMVSGRMPVNPGRGSYSASTREASPSTIRNSSSGSQRFYSASHGFNGTANQRNTYSNNTRSAEPNMNRGSRPETQTRSANPSNGANRGNAGNNGWHTFTPPSSNGGNRASNGANRPSLNSQPNNRSAMGNNGRGAYGAPNNAGRGGYNAPNANRGGGYEAPYGRGSYGAPNAGRGGFEAPNTRSPYGAPNQNRGGYNAPSQNRGGFAPPEQSRGGYGAPNASRGGFGGFGGGGSRPPLSMRQPIVRPRGGEGGSLRGGSGGGYRGGGGSHGSGGGGGGHKH